MTNLILSNSSRYKDTTLLTVNGNPQFGLFVLPTEFTDADPAAVQDTMGEAEAPFLDAVAARRYGPGSEPLWWIIAAMSGIVDLDRDATPGLSLLIPGFDTIEKFRSRDAIE